MSSTLYDSARAPMRYTGHRRVSKAEEKMAEKGIRELNDAIESRLSNLLHEKLV